MTQKTDLPPTEPNQPDPAAIVANQTKVRAERLITKISELRARAIALEQSHLDEILRIAPSYQASARNLLHYLALRQVDLRPLQTELAALGLTSLGSREAQTLGALDALLVALHAMAGKSWQPDYPTTPLLNMGDGSIVLDYHSQLLLGSPAGKRSVRIMVTMPSEASWDYLLVRNLLAAGMDVMRINCAHDDEHAWLGMVNNLRRAERELGRSAKIYADLAGPKLRTGAIEPIGRVVKYRPRRNLRGEVIEPAQVWLTPADSAGDRAAGRADDPAHRTPGDRAGPAGRRDRVQGHPRQAARAADRPGYRRTRDWPPRSRPPTWNRACRPG